MKQKVFLLLMAVAFLFGCSETGNKHKHKEAKGGVYYGGIFRMNQTEEFRSLYPLNVTEVVSQAITNQIYEGLVKLSQKDLTITPCLAEKWEINDSATVFTFHLRKGVRFHDDPCFKNGEGREVNAHDFKYCFDKLCEASSTNQGFWIFKDRVIGAKEYYASTLNKNPLPGGVNGVRVIDDYTLQFRLEYPPAPVAFLNVLTMPFAFVFPKEAVEKYGAEMRVKCVGTGPFLIKEVKEGDAVILERNENYWGVDEFGNQLPYLDAIKVTFLKDKKSELLEFKKGNLDMLHQLPVEMIKEIMGSLQDVKGDYAHFQYQITPALALQYYGFQHQSEIFKNKDVRLAFNCAIDRQKIVDFVLQGEGIPATHGIVPPSFKDYDAEGIKGYEFDVNKAKKYLVQAGYPNGKGFPKLTLQLNSGGSRHTQVAEAIQKMLKENLNIEVELNIMPFAQSLESIETGKALFWRAGWVADYPDPENFLTLLYGGHIPTNPTEKSYINSMRYKNPRFDSLVDAALKEVDTQKRFSLYKQADQLAIDEAAIMPILYDENYRLLQENVKNFDANAMEYRDFRAVYFVPADKLPKKKESSSAGK